MGRNRAIVWSLVAAAAVYWATRFGVPELGARALAILVLAAGLWATEALPLFATAFVVIGLEILLLAGDGGWAGHLTALLRWLGLSVRDGAAAPIGAGAFLAPLAHDVVILFLGGFLLSAAISKHGVDRVLMQRVLPHLGASPRALLFGVLGLTAFFSMWMSNTATAAIMVGVLGPQLADRDAGDPSARALLLAVAFGANIGGIGTPIGTPPNAIAYGALNAAGYPVTFLTWMLVAVPLVILLLIATGALLLRRYPPAAFLEQWRRRVQLVEPAPLASPVSRDADDDVVLASAVAGGASVIVTGDQDLLVLGRFNNIDIIPPREFLKRLAS